MSFWKPNKNIDEEIKELRYQKEMNDTQHKKEEELKRLRTEVHGESMFHKLGHALNAGIQSGKILPQMPREPEKKEERKEFRGVFR